MHSSAAANSIPPANVSRKGVCTEVSIADPLDALPEHRASQSIASVSLCRNTETAIRIQHCGLQVLDTRRNEIMEELLELLMSFVDFQAFKELMLAHKSESRTCSIHVRDQCITAPPVTA